MKEQLLSIGSKILNIIFELLLSLFYLFCFVCIIGGAFYFYSRQVRQQKLILKIEKSITIQDVGDKISLPVKSDIDINKLVCNVENEDVVIINQDGKIVAMGEGTTVVTIYTNDNKKTQTILVSVGHEAIEKVKNEDYVDDLLAKAKEKQKETNN